MPALASDTPQNNYQDGVLHGATLLAWPNCPNADEQTETIRFIQKCIASGKGCAMGGTESALDSPSKLYAWCDDGHEWLYTVQARDKFYILTPKHTALDRRQPLTVIGMFQKDDALVNQ